MTDVSRLSDDEIDRTVMELLLGDETGRGAWSTAEVKLAVGDDIAAADSLRRLEGSGLVHRLGRFVFATRPAARAVQLFA